MFKVVILEFKRTPASFLDFVLIGNTMAKIRSAMLAVGRPCLFADGAKIFAQPEKATMRIKLFGISVEQIILEVEFCEPSKIWGDAEHNRLPDWTPSPRRLEFRRASEIDFRRLAGVPPARTLFSAEAEAGEDQFRKHFGKRAAWETIPGAGGVRHPKLLRARKLPLPK
jgi:hypothetical protein